MNNSQSGNDAMPELEEALRNALQKNPGRIEGVRVKDMKWPAKGGIKIIPPVPVDYFTLIEKIGFRNKEMSDLEETMRNAVRRNPECLPKYFKELKKIRAASGETDTRSSADYLKELGFDDPMEITALLMKAGY